MYTVTTPGQIGQFTINIHRQRISYQHHQQMYRTSNGSEKCGNRRRQKQDRVPITIHWSKEFGIWTQDKETGSGSIPNGEDDLIFYNNVRISENRKGKLTDDNEKFSNLLLYMRL